MQRKEEALQTSTPVSTTNPQAEVPKLVTVGFTIKCAYTPTKANTSKDGTVAANQPQPQQPQQQPNPAANPQKN
jgi:hypothetical protein